MTPTEKVLRLNFAVCICVGCVMWIVEWLFFLHIFLCIVFHFFFSLSLYLSHHHSLTRSLSLSPLSLSFYLVYSHAIVTIVLWYWNSHSVWIKWGNCLCVSVRFTFILIHSFWCESCACHRWEAMTTKCYSIRAHRIVNIRLRKEQQQQQQNVYRVRRVRREQRDDAKKTDQQQQQNFNISVYIKWSLYSTELIVYREQHHSIKSK